MSTKVWSFERLGGSVWWRDGHSKFPRASFLEAHALLRILWLTCIGRYRRMPCALSKSFFGSQSVLSSVFFQTLEVQWTFGVEGCTFDYDMLNIATFSYLLGWFRICPRPLCPSVILWMKRRQHYVYICLPRLPGDTPPGERYAETSVLFAIPLCTSKNGLPFFLCMFVSSKMVKGPMDMDSTNP